MREELFEGIEIKPIKRIVVDENSLKQVPSILQKYTTSKKLTIICDQNTYDAAGKEVISSLRSEGFDLTICKFDMIKHLVPDERSIGEIVLKMDPQSELLIAIGSGTVNDLTRFVSFKTKIPYGVIATAPSMDGYTSSVSPLITNGFKRTYNAAYPQFVIGDLDVLSKAPYEMITSGFGDIIGKYTSLADWMISSVVNGEDYSEDIAGIVRKSIEKCVQTADLMKERNRATVENVMDALVLSGIAMLKVGNSRPASGAEHHIAHYMEIKDLMRGKIPAFHGASVGVAETIVTDIYHKIFSMNVDDIKRSTSQRNGENETEYKKRIESCFGPISNEIFEEIGDFYMNESERIKRQEKIVENWNDLKKWVEESVPTSGQIKKLLETVGAPTDLKSIGSDLQITDIVENAKEIRKRYTILRLADDIGLDVKQYGKTIAY